MDQKYEAVNQFLVEVFNTILKTEEACIAKEFNDLSVRELHVIEAVCSAQDKGSPYSAASIAADIHVTAGTLTTAVTYLERKGYLLRNRDGRDRRIVQISATEKGLKAHRWHSAFHREMVEHLFQTLSDDEADILLKALNEIGNFFKNKYGNFGKSI